MNVGPKGMYARQLDLASPRQWHDLVPKDLLAQVARDHGGDRADGKLTAPVHFWLLVVAGLSKGCSALKDLLSLFQTRFGPLFGLPHDRTKPWVTPAALSQRNAARPVAFWQTLYQRLRQHHFGTRWLRKTWQKKFVALEALDASTFRLMARLRHVFTPSGSGGAKKGSRNRTGALKVHQVYNVGAELPAELAIGPAREHDAKAWRKALGQARDGVLYLLDRGYCDFQLWWAIERAGSFFITPLKSNLVYEHLRWLNPKRQRERVRDHWVLFPGMAEGDDFVILRLVEIRQADGTWWRYVTNIVEDLTPQEVGEIYSLRWRIEIFFRHLKHTMNLGHWFAESEYGVLAQLYAALIGYVLSQVVLLWASRETGRAPEQFRFSTVVHELARWLVAQLYHNQLLDRKVLLDHVCRNATERDHRRNSHVFDPLPP